MKWRIERKRKEGKKNIFEFGGPWLGCQLAGLVSCSAFCTKRLPGPGMLLMMMTTTEERLNCLKAHSHCPIIFSIILRDGVTPQVEKNLEITGQQLFHHPTGRSITTTKQNISHSMGRFHFLYAHTLSRKARIYLFSKSHQLESYIKVTYFTSTVYKTFKYKYIGGL